MDKFIGTVRHFIFQLTFYHIFWVLLQPPPPQLMLLGGNEVKILCRPESGPVHARHCVAGGGGRGEASEIRRMCIGLKHS